MYDWKVISNFYKKKKEIFLKEINSDYEMSTLKKFIEIGWPRNKNKLPEVIKKYHNIAGELYLINGWIFRNNRLVVPKNLRREMINLIHYNHLGLEKCRNRAREILFWPMMGKEL